MFEKRRTMFKIVAIIVLIGVAFADPIKPFSSTASRVEDDPAKIAIEKIPYHVGVRIEDFNFCSGTILSKDWILTSAQCGSRHFRNYNVRAGSSYTDIGGSIHNISQIIMHENFSTDSSLFTSNDIALIRLTNPLTIDATRRPIELYRSDEVTTVGKDAVLSGYGWVRGSHQKREGLLIQNVTVISKDYCKEAYSYLAPKDPSQICTDFSVNDSNLCHNDVGGPLTVNGRLAGIVVRGTGCPGRGRPLVYTDVAYFRNWIKQHSGI